MTRYVISLPILAREGLRPETLCLQVADLLVKISKSETYCRLRIGSETLASEYSKVGNQCLGRPIFCTIGHLLTLSLLFFIFSSTPAQTAISQKRIGEVVAHFETHAALIDSLACAFNLDAIPVLSVVGPEWVRYSMVRDMMETKALEFAYVRFGREAADFSIGPFQMKPSFIEDLEKVAGIGYASADPAMQRRLRLQRLKDIRWQFYYAFAFYAHSQNRFAAVLTAGESQQLAFIASAYNFGFTKPLQSIEKWQHAAVFPYGGAFRGRQESYARVALRFYEMLRSRRGEVW